MSETSRQSVFRFSLQSLLLVTTAAAGACGIVKGKIEHDRAQTVSQIRALWNASCRGPGSGAFVPAIDSQLESAHLSWSAIGVSAQERQSMLVHYAWEQWIFLRPETCPFGADYCRRNQQVHEQELLRIMKYANLSWEDIGVREVEACSLLAALDEEKIILPLPLGEGRGEGIKQ